MKQKGLAPIIIVLLIAIGIGGYLLYQNQPKLTIPPSQQTVEPAPSSADETANWRTYTNTKYKFTLNYPPDFTVSETDFSTIKDLHPKNKTEFRVAFANDPDFKNKLLLTQDKSILNIGISIWKTNEESLTKALTEYHTFLEDDNLPNGVNRMINDITLLHRNYTNISSVPVSEYALLKEDRLFLFEATPSDSQLNDTADQILSTFKFTN